MLAGLIVCSPTVYICRFSQYLPGTAQNPVPAQFQGSKGGPLPEYWVSRVDMGETSHLFAKRFF